MSLQRTYISVYVSTKEPIKNQEVYIITDDVTEHVHVSTLQPIKTQRVHIITDDVRRLSICQHTLTCLANKDCVELVHECQVERIKLV